MQQAASALAYGEVKEPRVFVDPNYERISVGTEKLFLDRLREGMQNLIREVKGGIDRPNVRFIVIFKPSLSLITTMQMVGRAGRDGRESHVFFAPTENDAPSFRVDGPAMPWELGQLVYKKEGRVHQAVCYMDGEELARPCRRRPSQVPCDVWNPDGELHKLAMETVKHPGRPRGPLRETEAEFTTARRALGQASNAVAGPLRTKAQVGDGHPLSDCARRSRP